MSRTGTAGPPPRNPPAGWPRHTACCRRCPSAAGCRRAAAATTACCRWKSRTCPAARSPGPTAFRGWPAGWQARARTAAPALKTRTPRPASRAAPRGCRTTAGRSMRSTASRRKTPLTPARWGSTASRYRSTGSSDRTGTGPGPRRANGRAGPSSAICGSATRRRTAPGRPARSGRRWTREWPPRPVAA
ncbi:hypothetical protein D3C71_1509990 [compost metagenome]